MDMEQLQTFSAVVEHRSFTKAASALHLSQPAVTRQVAALEMALSAKLLDRRIRQVTPTAAGIAVQSYASRILGLAKDCRKTVEAVERGVIGHLRVAASGTAATYLLPSILAEFRNRHPAIDISVHTCGSDAAARMVADDSADAAVVMDFRGHPELKQIRAGRYNLVATMACSHRLASRRAVTIEDLTDEPLIVMLPGTNLRRLVDGIFHAKGAAPRITVEVDHLEAMKKMAAAQLGVAIVPDLVVKDDRDGVHIAPIRDTRRPQRYWSVVYRKNLTENTAIRFFLQCMPR